MNTYIALFRGINVGGNNILPMKELVSILEKLGCQNVRTYIQSGNVIFQINRSQEKNIETKINSGILKSSGFDPKILLLTVSEFLNVVKNNPFIADNGKAVHFFFLSSTSSQPDLGKINKIKTASEKYLLKRKVFYLYAPKGIGRSKLAASVERCLGVTVTARNLNTINKLVPMLK
jgi:uncharacterized protein (DUF1697 family)